MTRIRTAVYWLRNMFTFFKFVLFLMFEYKQPCGAIEKSTKDDVFAGTGIFLKTMLMNQCLYPVILKPVLTTNNIKDMFRPSLPQC